MSSFNNGCSRTRRFLDSRNSCNWGSFFYALVLEEKAIRTNCQGSKKELRVTWHDCCFYIFTLRDVLVRELWLDARCCTKQFVLNSQTQPWRLARRKSRNAEGSKATWLWVDHWLKRGNPLFSIYISNWHLSSPLETVDSWDWVRFSLISNARTLASRRTEGN